MYTLNIMATNYRKTKFVGVKELRQNMAKLTDEARAKNLKLVVMKHNKPIFELNPIANDAVWDDEGIYDEEFVKGLKKQIADIKSGKAKTYTIDEVRSYLGLEQI